MGHIVKFDIKDINVGSSIVLMLIYFLLKYFELRGFEMCSCSVLARTAYASFWVYMHLLNASNPKYEITEIGQTLLKSQVIQTPPIKK